MYHQHLRSHDRTVISWEELWEWANSIDQIDLEDYIREDIVIPELFSSPFSSCPEDEE